MKILVAPDKFKGSLSALEICNAVEAGIKLVDSSLEVIKCPLADGGDGTAQILTYHTEGKMFHKIVKDPLLREVNAAFGISGDGRTAFIEMAAASGLALLKKEERNCLKTTSYGTGQLILEAIKQGVKQIILGIGGSATNDAGMGLANALGYKFLDVNGKELQPIGENLLRVIEIDDTDLLFNADEVKIKIACDVDNPLFGEQGAAYIFAPQKGADDQAVVLLDKGLQHINSIFKGKYHIDANKIPGAGAAGGVGAGGVVFLNAELIPGNTLVHELIDFEGLVKDADLVITGEGKMDEQTLRGKVVKGVTDITYKYQIPTVALCGALEADASVINELQIDFAASVVNQPMSLEDAMKVTEENVSNSAFNIVKFWLKIQRNRV